MLTVNTRWLTFFLNSIKLTCLVCKLKYHFWGIAVKGANIHTYILYEPNVKPIAELIFTCVWENQEKDFVYLPVFGKCYSIPNHTFIHLRRITYTIVKV